MSKCSKKCNEICEKIQSISGLDDNYVYDKLEAIDNIISAFVYEINLYADKNPFNGTCFK